MNVLYTCLKPHDHCSDQVEGCSQLPSPSCSFLSVQKEPIVWVLLIQVCFQGLQVPINRITNTVCALLCLASFAQCHDYESHLCYFVFGFVLCACTLLWESSICIYITLGYFYTLATLIMLLWISLSIFVCVWHNHASVWYLDSRVGVV